MIYGGSKYIEELGKTKYAKLINLLKKQTGNKIYVLDKEKVDQRQKIVEEMITDLDFDDPHLPAIAEVGKCKLVCSEDIRSIKFVTLKELYKDKTPPNYYTGKRNIDLLCDNYVTDTHKPLTKLTKKDQKIVEEIRSKIVK